MMMQSFMFTRSSPHDDRDQKEWISPVQFFDGREDMLFVWTRMLVNDALLTKRAQRFRDVEDPKNPIRCLGIRGRDDVSIVGAPSGIGLSGPQNPLYHGLSVGTERLVARGHLAFAQGLKTMRVSGGIRIAESDSGKQKREEMDGLCNLVCQAL